jgi:hypothetical protein
VDLKERVGKNVDWIHPAKDWKQWYALTETVMNFQVPKKAVNYQTR